MAVTWKVTTQSPATRPDRTGRVVPGTDVYFTTGSGISSSVFVPQTMYNPETVKDMINLAATQLEAVQGLSSES